MSAAVSDAFDPGMQEMSAAQWITGLRGSAPTHNGGASGDPFVAIVCAAAVDRLEIAAALEATGMSHRVVQNETDHLDVFALADELWSNLPYQEVDTDEPFCWRRGNVADLGRGALYAAPALFISAFSTAAHLHLRWWTLPLAMTWGWAMGQLTAFGGYRMRARTDADGEAHLVSFLLLLAAVSTAGLAWAASHYLGGQMDSVIIATWLTTYMVASSILLLHEEERLGALLLSPAAVAGTVSLIAPHQIPDWLVIATVGTAAIGTLLAAGRHLAWPYVRRSSVTRLDLCQASQHGFHGVLSGLALSVVVLLGVEQFEMSTRAAFLTIPLLATLGVMEWRLRTFRAEIESLSRDLGAIDDFASRALWIFFRGLAVYVIGIASASVAVAVVLRIDGSSPPYVVLVAEIGLGALYYTDLTLTSLGRLDVVLRSWATGVFAAATLFASARVFDAPMTTVGWWAAHIGVWITAILLLFAARRVVAAPCTH